VIMTMMTAEAVPAMTVFFFFYYDIGFGNCSIRYFFSLR
jgi:hypothetical protein